MNNQEWERFGEDIRRTVQDAVDSRDYRRLNQTITNTINQALNEAARSMRNMGNARNRGAFGHGWQNPDGMNGDFGPNWQGGGSYGNDWQNHDQGADYRYETGNAGADYQYGAGNAGTGYQYGSGNAGTDYQYGAGNAGTEYNYGRQSQPFETQNSNAMKYESRSKNQPALYASMTGAQAGGILLCAFGYPVAVISGILLLLGIAGLFLIKPGEALAVLIVSLVFTGVFGGMAGAGTSILKRIGRFKKYMSFLQDREYCDIKELAEKTGKTAKYVAKDLRKMIESGWFRQGHLDGQKTCLMVTDQAYDQYLQLEEQMREKERDEIYREQQKEKEARMQKEKQDQVKRETEKAREGLTPEVREIIEQGDAYIRKIHACNDAIPGEEISAKISRMEMIVDRIFDRVEQNPETVGDIRKLMEYYLPTTVKLLEAYEEMDRQPVGGENIQTAKAEIEATLDTLNLAFEKLLDSLFQDTAWDVSSDISVLHTMLAQEGLTEEEWKRKSGK